MHIVMPNRYMYVPISSTPASFTVTAKLFRGKLVEWILLLKTWNYYNYGKPKQTTMWRGGTRR